MTETIVNRTAKSAGQELEEARIAMDQAKPLVEAVLENPTVQAQLDLDKGPSYSRESVDYVNLSDQVIPTQTEDTGDQSEIPDTVYSVEAAALSVALREVAKLKAQVIKAFKHSGIDTRKFFGV